MKKLFAITLLSLLPAVSFAQNNSYQDLQKDGYKWFDSGSPIYSGYTPAMFSVCALDYRAYVTDRMADGVMVPAGSCLYVQGVELRLSNFSDGAMVKMVR